MRKLLSRYGMHNWSTVVLLFLFLAMLIVNIMAMNLSARWRDLAITQQGIIEQYERIVLPHKNVPSI